MSAFAQSVYIPYQRRRGLLNEQNYSNKNKKKFFIFYQKRKTKKFGNNNFLLSCFGKTVIDKKKITTQCWIESEKHHKIEKSSGFKM
jgi:hypothetical protein